MSALANTVGGDFIIGIEARDGIPINLKGVSFSNADDEILRLEQILQTGLEPRLPSQNIKNIQSPNGDNFIFIRVNRSWIAPHRIKCKDKDFNDKFYGRHSGGNYPMDVSELRTAFMLTEQLSERIKNFRQERVQIIRSRYETPVSLIDGGKMILHLFPLESFTTPTEFDVIELRRKAQFKVTSNNKSEINLDGVVVAPYFEKDTTSYTQVFRNCCIERVFCLNGWQHFGQDDQNYSSRYDEEQIIQAASDFIAFYSELDIDLPIYLFLTLINIKDYKFHIDDAFRSIYEIRRKTVNNQKIVFNRSEMIFPEIIIDDFSQPPEQLLRSVFNKIWNSVGLTRDFNYDSEGNWIEDPRSISRN